MTTKSQHRNRAERIICQICAYFPPFFPSNKRYSDIEQFRMSQFDLINHTYANVERIPMRYSIRIDKFDDFEKMVPLKKLQTSLNENASDINVCNIKIINDFNTIFIGLFSWLLCFLGYGIQLVLLCCFVLSTEYRNDKHFHIINNIVIGVFLTH